jgi:hypothetical protein
MIINDPKPRPVVTEMKVKKDISEKSIREETPYRNLTPISNVSPAGVTVVASNEEALKGLSLDQIKRLNYGVGSMPPVMSRPQIDYLIDVF